MSEWDVFDETSDGKISGDGEVLSDTFSAVIIETITKNTTKTVVTSTTTPILVMSGIIVALIVIVVVIFVLLLVAGVYALDGAVHVAKVKNYKNISGLSKAHTILSWVGSLIVVGTVLLIIGAVILFFTGIGEIIAFAGGKSLVIISLVILCIVCVTAGVGTIIAAIDINSTMSTDDTDNDRKNKQTAYSDSYIAAILLITPSVLTVVSIIIITQVNKSKKKKAKKKQLRIASSAGESSRQHQLEMARIKNGVKNVDTSDIYSLPD